MTRLALVGAGDAGRIHGLAASAATGVTIASVTARSLGSAELLAAELGVKPVAVDRLPGRAGGAIVATPVASHAEGAIALMQGGVGVLIEQPLAATLAEADRIIETAERCGAAACYAENLLFAPGVDAATTARRELGALRHLEVRCHQPSPESGHLAEELSDGGVLFHVGPHAIALAMVLADEPVVSVRAELSSTRPDHADDLARVELRLASGLVGHLDVSWRGESTDWSAQVATDEGVVRLELAPEVVVEVDGAPNEFARASATSPQPRIAELGYVAQLEGFAAAVAGRGGRVCPAGFGRSVLEIIAAAYASAGRSGDEIAVPFDGPRDRTPLQLWHSPS